jgi:probable rRNA maturation factor
MLMTQYHLEISLENVSAQNTSINESQWQGWLTTWFNHLDLDLDTDKTYEINVRLTDDEEIQTLNRQFRHQDKPTDVLSFAALEDDFPEIEEMDAIALGDIIISLDTASRQANLENHSLEIELAWLASHGLLHILGWDHPDEESLREMLTIQTELLELVAINPPSLKQYFS